MRQKLPRAIGTLGLVFVLFFSTSGGPYTTETLIHSVGPGLGLLILALVPLGWSVPEALIVGELASMLPEEGGYYRWVDRAFGRFWAFQNGWLTWMYSLVDMAIYPVLFNQYLRYFIPGLDPRVEWLISLAIIWGAAWINVRGSVNVSRTSIIAGCFVMLGFLALSIASAPQITHVPWQPFASEHARGLGGLAVGISIALWNYIGWDNPSTVQGEVKDPSRTYPRALAIALPFVTLGYFVPLLTTLGASDWTTWSEGSWPQIAASSAGNAGRWIAIWIGLGGMVSALALFNALLLGYSRISFGSLAMVCCRKLWRNWTCTARRGWPSLCQQFSTPSLLLSVSVSWSLPMCSCIRLRSFLSSVPWFSFAKPNRHCAACSEFR